MKSPAKSVLGAAMLAVLAMSCRAGDARAQQLNPAASAAASAVASGDVARLAARVEAATSRAGADKGFWAMLVTDADTGRTIYSLHADQLFLPASNAKLFTTAMALGTLGPDFHVRTTIETAGQVDAGGRLRGDLVLVGRGDANVSNRVFPFSKKVERSGPPEKVLEDLSDQVAASGVKLVEGNVIADDSYFAPSRFPTGWTVDDTVWSYGAAVSAIAVNDNTLTITVKPGRLAGAALSAEIQPWTDFYQIRNEARTSRVGSEAQLRLARDPESRVFVLSGTLPVNAPTRQLQVAVPEPAENAAVLLKHLLEEKGVRVSGEGLARHEPGNPPGCCKTGARVVAEHVSPSLLEDVRATNKMSLNLHAELLLRLAAKEKGGAMEMDDAVKFAAQFRQGIGIGPEDARLNDGSGLSRDDLVSARSLVQLLTWAASQSWGSDFAATLPMAGVDGTLENRMKGTAAAGQVRAKTGLVEHVEALSGYATSAHGEHLIFSILSNNTSLRAHDATGVVDSICVAMIEELGSEQAPASHPQN